MKSELSVPKAVIDANVFVSALMVAGGIPARLIEHLEHDAYQLYYPACLIVELQKTQLRPRLAARIKPNRLSELLDLIDTKGVFVEIQNSPAVSRDPKDDDYLECAVIGQAQFIVTGDLDLLCLKEHRSTQIVTPRHFLDFIERVG
jgi:putative PIN family toxin of toxin-antitoxin system